MVWICWTKYKYSPVHFDGHQSPFINFQTVETFAGTVAASVDFQAAETPGNQVGQAVVLAAMEMGNEEARQPRSYRE